MLKKHPVTIRRLVRRKRDPLPSHKVGGTLRYWPGEIKAWINRQGIPEHPLFVDNRSASDVLGKISKI